jgi:hypothetical protein
VQRSESESRFKSGNALNMVNRRGCWEMRRMKASAA